MRKSLRKILISSLLFVLALFISVNVNASEVTDLEGTKYYVESVKESNELAYGVKQETHISYSSVAPGHGSGNADGYKGSGQLVPNEYYPQQVNILEVPSNENIKITPWAVVEPFNWTLSTVKQMIRDYEKNNPGYRVIAAINGDFFDIQATKNFPRTPSGMHVSGGNFYKSSATNTVGFKNDGSDKPLLGNVKAERTAKMQLDIYNENNEIIKEFEIDKINESPGANEIAIYFAVRDANKKPIAINVENGFIVENADYALPHSETDFYGLGTISKVGSETLGDGQFAIVSNNQELTEALAVGVKIRAQYEFVGAFEGIEDAIGVGETILYNGERKGSDTVRHPRTMVGVREDGTIIMTVVDGRQGSKNMYGATSYEMAAILKHYGAVEGYNLDGGGSSTMVILKDGEYVVMNSPSDGYERSDSNCILITAKIPEIDLSVSNITTTGFTVNANLINKNGHDFDKLFVGVDDKIVEVKDNKAVIEGLNVNTNYYLKLYGEKDGKYEYLAIDLRASTAKKKPTISKLLFQIVDDDIQFTIELNDPQNAIKSRVIIVNGVEQTFVGNVATFEDFDGDLSDVSVKLIYDVNDGQGETTKTITNVELRCGIKDILYLTKEALNDKITSIYN
ncbi:MAG TPA: phosphodiester glycosidase family protein [Acholeplasmataceae bacterium]|nr:phosphodiester glycosidase family protein [Acholeplasmataceae bacterium]